MKRSPARRKYRLAAIAILLCAATLPGSAQEPSDGFSLAPGVLLHPADGVAYLMAPRRQVDAVAVRTGELLWSTSAAARPVAVRGDDLIAQVEKPEPDSNLTLAVLNRRDGESRASGSIDLGTGVIAAIDDGKDYSFLLGTETAATGSGPILWRYFEQKLPGPDEPLRPPFERFGALAVSETASISAVAGRGFSRASGRPPYARPRISRPVSEEPAPGTVIRDLGTGAQYRRDRGQIASGADDGASAETAAGMPLADGELRLPAGGLILSERGTGDEFPSARRIPGDQFAYSVDDRYIAASEFSGKVESAEPYLWTIYSRGTFEVVARYAARTSLAPFQVVDGVVLYLRQPFQVREGGKLQDYPPALIARSAETGRILWTRAVRDTGYRGPIPDQPR